MRAMKCAVLLAVLVLLSGCGNQTVPETTASTIEPVTSVEMVVTEDTIQNLEAYSVLSGRICGEAAAMLQFWIISAAIPRWRFSMM